MTSNIWKYIREIQWWEYLIAIIGGVLSCLHFYQLSSSPAGFYVDEAAGAAHVMCLQQTGYDFFGNRLQWFIPSLGGGYTTAIFAVMQYGWTSIVGDTIAGFRSFSVMLYLATLVGIGILAKYFLGRSGAWIAMTFFSFSSWAFIATRMAWDPPLVLPFLVWGVVCAVVFRQRWYVSVLTGIFFSLALFSYPPTKIQIACMVPLLLWYRYGSDIKKMIQEQWAGALFFLAASLILLLYYISHPESLARSQMLSIFSDVYWDYFRIPPTEKTFFGVLQLFLTNLGSYFSFEYLFFSGDSNLRHSTGFMGMLTGFEIMGVGLASLVLALKKTPWLQKKTILLFLLIIFFGILPAALTWEANPHGLRSIGALPFISVVATLGIVWAWQRWKSVWFQWIVVLCFSMSIVWSIAFIYDFFTQYPHRSERYFGYDIIEVYSQNNIAKARFLMNQKKYNSLTQSFFLMHFEHKTCQQAQELLKK